MADYLNCKLPYDKFLFDLSRSWGHIHLCYQCKRKFGCNGDTCEPDDSNYDINDDYGWCAECAESEIPKSVGGN